jgi:hypothetical protein
MVFSKECKYIDRVAPIVGDMVMLIRGYRGGGINGRLTISREYASCFCHTLKDTAPALVLS